MYLGHHWGYRREMGEPQITFNYVAALANFINNFCFSKGVHFITDKQVEHIVPALLRRIWEVDNNKAQTLWEMGNQGGVSGDCFVKVAYDPPYQDELGMVNPGRVRILPLNSSFAFPEWHPHDRDRLLRFKLKYRFWGCVDTKTEALTRQGWKRHDEINVGDEILALDPETDEIRWETVEDVNTYGYDGEMVRWNGKIDAVTTPNHRWLAERQTGRMHTVDYTREIVRSRLPIDGDKALPDLRNGSRVVVGGGTPMAFADVAKWSDELVETAAWYITEGCDHVNQSGCKSIYLAQKNSEYLSRIRRLAVYWRNGGGTFSEYKPKKDGVVEFYLGKGVKEPLWEVAPNKEITADFIASLTFAQAQLFYNTLLDADGCRTHGTKKTVRWTQIDGPRKDAFQMLCAMLGKRTTLTSCGEKVQEYNSRYIGVKTIKDNTTKAFTDDGKVWCPTLPSGIWFARRNGSTYWTGNTSAEGTRQVYTYVEIITDQAIEEYINDELIDSRPNPLGTIPIVHISNVPVSGSPWGLADIADVIDLNRQYNEIATDIEDIINYHCVDEETEILTRNGWKFQDEVIDGEEILARNPLTDAIEWQPATFNRFAYDGMLTHWDNHIDALTTPGHRWLVERREGRDRHYVREFSRTNEVSSLTQGSRIVVGGGIPAAFAHEPKWSDELVETVGWYLTEGSDMYSPQGWHSASISQKKSPHVDTIRRLAEYWKREGATFTENSNRSDGVVTWYLGKGVNSALREAAPGKKLTPEFITSLTYHQAALLRKTLIDGDGTRVNRENWAERTIWYQDDPIRKDGYQMLDALLGIRTRQRDAAVDEYQRPTILVEHTVPRAMETRYEGIVWCPTVESGVWFARRNGSTYWTGNSAPVTVILGAKSSNLEKGPKKVWGGLPKDANVFNLENGVDLAGPMEFLQTLKTAMHEMTGVPESALGQMQPISNTSGVALAIQYQPMMQRRSLKLIQYSTGIKKINKLALKTLFIFEPESVNYDPQSEGIIRDDQQPFVDPADPMTYEIECEWAPPLPVDALIKLNEIQAKMALGLESKRGALRDLGEEFVDEKMMEIFEELIQDAKDAGALKMLQAQLDSVIYSLTGMAPEGSQPAEPQQDADGNTVNPVGPPPMPALPGGVQMGTMDPEAIQRMTNELVTQAYGPRMGLRRTPDTDNP